MAGFVDKKYAIRKLVRNPDGTVGVIFVDPKTGQQVENPEGYNIVEARNNVNAPGGTNIKTEQEAPKKEETGFSKRFIESETRPDRPDAGPSGKQMGDQYGYVNKPGWTSLAGFAPQPFGILGTLGNLGVNASNTAAVNRQRDVLGFAEPSTMKNVGSTLIDKNGYIGDATYGTGRNQRTTPVSFEGVDPAGRTTLTPNEARMRNELNPTFREATEAEVQNARSEFESQYGKQGGFLGGIAEAAKGLFGNIFGSDTNTTSKSTSKAPAGATPTTGGQESGGVSQTSPSTPAPNSSGSPDDRDEAAGNKGLY